MDCVSPGVGGHGGTGIHADKKDKYREIIQRLSQHATPDVTRAIETETEVSSKRSHVLDQLSNYTEYADRYSMESTLSSLIMQNEYAPVPLRAYPTHAAPVEPLAVDTSPRDMTMRPVEQVHVTQCRICTIL